MFDLIKVLLFIILTQSWLGNIQTSKHKNYRLSQSNHFDLIQQSISLFENKTLTICVVVREPFVLFNNIETPPRFNGSVELQNNYDNMKDLNNYSGIAIEVLKLLSKIFKFKINLVRPADNEFGILKANKTWSGVVGSLARKQSDIGITALSITFGRSEVVDFTRAYYVETAAILLPIPEEVQNYSAMIEPFSLSVWLVLLTTIIILILLIAIMTKLEEDQRKQHKLAELLKFKVLNKLHMKSNDREENPKLLEDKLRDIQQKLIETTWLDRFYYAITCVLNILLIRDIKSPPKQTPIRILVCIWWLSTIVIINIYLGILFGQLVVPRRPKSIDTLEELVNQEKIEWCVTSGSALDMLFRRSDLKTIYGQLGARMKIVQSADQGVERVIQSGWAFIRERSMLTFKVAQEHNRLKACKLQMAKAEFFSVGFGLALQKGSKYLKPINSALTLMIENGLLSHWQSIYWPIRNQFTECKLQPLREGEPLSIKHFISIYMISSLAILLSAIILVYQNIHEHLIEAQLKPIWDTIKRKRRNTSERIK